MASAYQRPSCVFCGATLQDPRHLAIGQDGNLVACCELCFDRFKMFVGGKNNGGKRKTGECTERPDEEV